MVLPPYRTRSTSVTSTSSTAAHGTIVVRSGLRTSSALGPSSDARPQPEHVDHRHHGQQQAHRRAVRHRAARAATMSATPTSATDAQHPRDHPAGGQPVGRERRSSARATWAFCPGLRSIG